jgi:hypothetical protein
MIFWLFIKNSHPHKADLTAVSLIKKSLIIQARQDGQL